MFIKILQAKSNQGAKAQPTLKDSQEIIQNLNRGAFFERKKLTDKNLKQKLDWARHQGNLNCHDVNRELVKLINYPNLQRFSGYLTLKKMPLSQSIFSTLSIKLKHHSVIKDLKNNIFFECIPDIYPLDKYVFIPHSSGLQGWDLTISFS